MHQHELASSLPASDTGASPHAQADDAEEGFEIVRRRLFEPLITQEQFKDRDLVAREFFDLYRTQHEEFPPECRNADYERRIKAAYPIHPEIFDRLRTGRRWSSSSARAASCA